MNYELKFRKHPTIWEKREYSDRDYSMPHSPLLYPNQQNEHKEFKAMDVTPLP